MTGGRQGDDSFVFFFPRRQRPHGQQPQEHHRRRQQRTQRLRTLPRGIIISRRCNLVASVDSPYWNGRRPPVIANLYCIMLYKLINCSQLRGKKKKHACEKRQYHGLRGAGDQIAGGKHYGGAAGDPGLSGAGAGSVTGVTLRDIEAAYMREPGSLEAEVYQAEYLARPEAEKEKLRGRLERAKRAAEVYQERIGRMESNTCRL